ncbi:MAG: hypothetical protein LBL84_02100 [Candidatus Nomurabacteria bacterium]|nr:hypothetical protein [Candidatus Nomurabacteria bacterium]
MGKAKIRRDLKLVRKVKTWQLLPVLILMLFVTATLLRLNNIAMTSRLEAVLAADKNGDKKQLDSRLYELKKYVFAHVTLRIDQDGTGTKVHFGSGPFYLEESYKRDAQAILDQAAQSAATSSSGNIYKQVSDICDPLAKRYGWGYSQPYFDCFSRELAKFNAAAETPLTVELPSTELYRLNYASPIWAPDFVGFAMLICLLLVALLLIKLIAYVTLRVILLKYHKKSKKR